MATESEQAIWLEIATTFYNYSLSLGITGLSQPNPGDTVIALMRKVSIYTARIYNLSSQ